ncbi:MAG: hypothetical protein M0Q44_15250 [Methylobacter sp.]|jgi:hypothetical protein|nr:hypothetical protein [Methylobacter sp.]
MNKYAAFKLNRPNLLGLLIFLPLLLSSANALAELQIAREAEVKSCNYLAEIEGNSGYGKNYNWQSLAKDSVLAQAEKMAATHVVWMQFNPVGGFNGVAVAKAYRCQLAYTSDQ